MTLALALVVTTLAPAPDTTPPTLAFAPWTGPAYSMTTDEVNVGFDPDILLREALAEISLPRLDLAETRADEHPFPGLPGRSHAIGMRLESSLTVSEAGCYILSLSSDDGSVLWINEQLVLENDGPHQLETVTDTVYLEAGAYPARLWYFNAFPPLYALTLTSAYTPSGCAPLGGADTLTLSASALFATDQVALSAPAVATLDSLAAALASRPRVNVWVVGHTDDRASAKYNLDLSTRRAQAVVDYLRAALPTDAATFGVEGRGETEPVADNATAPGRARNRRVEVIMQ